jgi:hypothetical protein
MAKGSNTDADQSAQIEYARQLKTPLPLIAVSAEQIEAAKARIRQRIAQAIREADYHADPGAMAGYLSDLRALDHIAPAEAAQKETAA